MYTQNEIIKKVNKEFIGYLILSNEKHSLSPDTDIMQDLTLDSLDHVELVMAIEEEFDINITDAEASHCVTMQDVYKLVAEKLGVKYTTFMKVRREDLLNPNSDTVSGSGVHAESGSVNDTRKNVSDNISALDTLCNVCQEHGLYMTVDPHGEVIVTEAASDVEYEVESEDQLQKLLSALEVLNGYVK